MSDSLDIILDMIARLRSMEPEFPADKAARLEQELRRDWAGTEPYVPAEPRQNRAARVEAALNDMHHGISQEDVLHRYGLSRATLYRQMLARKNRQ